MQATFDEANVLDVAAEGAAESYDLDGADEREPDTAVPDAAEDDVPNPVVMIWCQCGPRSRCLLLLLLATCWARSMVPRGRSCSERLRLIEGSLQMSLLMLCSAVLARMGAPSLFGAVTLGPPSWPALPCGMTRRSPPARTQ